MATALVTPDDVQRAARTIAGRLVRTPILDAEWLAAGACLKAELFQVTGSFKPRGVLATLLTLSPEERARGVIAASAGNHAAALAWGAAAEGLDALVVMFQGASAFKRELAEAYGAAVDDSASGPGEVFDRLAVLEDATGRVHVHPHDDPRVFAGHGTAALEILDDVPGVDTIVVPCGGGGLVAGIASAVVPSGVRVVAVEPEGSRALHDALRAGRPVPVETSSIADGLASPIAGRLAVETCVALGVESILVSDNEIEGAFRSLYAHAKLACEPAAAVAVAAVESGKVLGERVVCVVSGGNVSPQIATAILASR